MESWVYVGTKTLVFAAAILRPLFFVIC